MGIRQKVSVKLKPAEVESLRSLFRGGTQVVRVLQRARVLLSLNEGQGAPEAGRNVGYTAPAVRKIVIRYRTGGLNRALYDSPRPGAAPILEAAQKQRIIAMACSDPPSGCARWTVRLITEEAIQRKLVPTVGRETIRLWLLHHDFQPWREKNVVCGNAG